MGPDWTNIGLVRTVNPARRELRVQPVGRFAAEVEKCDAVWIALGEKPMKCKVTSVRSCDVGFLLTLAPGVSRDSVRAMKGARVMLPDDALRAEDDRAWDIEDLPGIAVYGEDGAMLGTVSEVMPTSAGGVITVEQADGARILLPLTEALVRDVDVPGRRMDVADIAPFAVYEPLPTQESTGDAD